MNNVSPVSSSSASVVQHLPSPFQKYNVRLMDNSESCLKNPGQMIVVQEICRTMRDFQNGKRERWEYFDSLDKVIQCLQRLKTNVIVHTRILFLSLNDDS